VLFGTDSVTAAVLFYLASMQRTCVVPTLSLRAVFLSSWLAAVATHADMLSYPGSTHLVVTHKSLLRSMLCTAMGLPPRQFRAIDLANGAVCMVR
jgi:hypothetical protein